MSDVKAVSTIDERLLSDGVDLTSETIRSIVIGTLVWYAQLEGDVSLRARLALGFISGNLPIVQCFKCGAELVQLPAEGHEDDEPDPDEKPICPDCVGVSDGS